MSFRKNARRASAMRPHQDVLPGVARLKVCYRSKKHARRIFPMNEKIYLINGN